MNKIEKAMIGIYCKMYNGFNKVMKDEKGDTNFISILIILGIVIIVAGVFIVYKNQILKQVSDQMQNFKIDSDSLGG